MILIFTYFQFCNREIFINSKIKNTPSFRACSSNRNQCVWQIKICMQAARPQKCHLHFFFFKLDHQQHQYHQHYIWCFHRVKDKRTQMQSKDWCCTCNSTHLISNTLKTIPKEALMKPFSIQWDFVTRYGLLWCTEKLLSQKAKIRVRVLLLYLGKWVNIKHCAKRKDFIYFNNIFDLKVSSTEDQKTKLDFAFLNKSIFSMEAINS